MNTAAPGKIYLVSDGEEISTSRLIREIAQALGKPARLFSCPPRLIGLMGYLTGKSAIVNRLLESLAVGFSKIRISGNCSRI